MEVFDGQAIAIRALIARRQAGVKLSRAEIKQLAEFEEQQRARIAIEFIRNCPKKLLFDWSRRQSKQWLEWHDRYNIPYVADKQVKFVDLTRIIHWIAEFLADNHDLLSAAASDPMIVANSTHAERYRAAKADMAEDERDMRRRSLLPKAPVHEILVRWSARLRKCGDDLRRKHGNDAGDMLLDALVECEAIIQAVLDDKT